MRDEVWAELAKTSGAEVEAAIFAPTENDFLTVLKTKAEWLNSA